MKYLRHDRALAMMSAVALCAFPIQPEAADQVSAGPMPNECGKVTPPQLRPWPIVFCVEGDSAGTLDPLTFGTGSYQERFRFSTPIVGTEHV